VEELLEDEGGLSRLLLSSPSDVPSSEELEEEEEDEEEDPVELAVAL
jgi:hypothetical protein